MVAVLFANSQWNLKWLPVYDPEFFVLEFALMLLVGQQEIAFGL